MNKNTPLITPTFKKSYPIIDIEPKIMTDWEFTIRKLKLLTLCCRGEDGWCRLK